MEVRQSRQSLGGCLFNMRHAGAGLDDRLTSGVIETRASIRSDEPFERTIGCIVDPKSKTEPASVRVVHPRFES